MSNQYSAGNETRGKRPIPWLWLAFGALLSIGAIILLVSLTTNYLFAAPDDTLVEQDPTVIRLTAPPMPSATVVAVLPTAAVRPTTTPVPTIDVSVAPAELTPGYYAQVVETGGVGVTVRNGPSTRNVPVVIAAEGAVVIVLEGPTDADSLLWWRVRLPNGDEGWAAGDFLTPVAAP